MKDTKMKEKMFLLSKSSESSRKRYPMKHCVKWLTLTSVCVNP